MHVNNYFLLCVAKMSQICLGFHWIRTNSYTIF